MLGQALASLALVVSALAASQSYTWKNIRMGAGGGFVPGIVFSTKEQNVAYARTDIGGAYRLNSDDTWTAITDWVNNTRWNQMGIDALALDPTDSSKLYMAAGLYTNSWDPFNGTILISTDKGNSFTSAALPFKVGGNMPGRGMGERLAVDPNSPNILLFGARSGNGLYKSTDYGKTWAKVTSLPNAGTYVPDSTDTTGYNSDKIGVSFVTFDSTSSSSGTATQRIFVGVASLGSSNVYMSSNGGTSWSAISGTNTSWIPHKGVLSPSEKVLYLSFSDGAGPYDGSYGGVYKYNITSATLTNITPVSGGDLYFGFGGLAVDLKTPGTLMVATLNCWWPDANIYRSTDSGATWSPLWLWNSYPTLDRYYKYDNSLAPWTGPDYNIGDATTAQIGWMIEALVIDPFDSNHWLYGTGAFIQGGHDLTNWDSQHNITLKMLSDGMDELAVLGLISPPSGPSLAAAVGDEAGYTFNSFTRAPLLSERWTNPDWATSNDIDYAGNYPTDWVRVGTGDTSTQQVAISTDSGTSWNLYYATGAFTGGTIAYSANADTILWSTSGNGVQVSTNYASFSSVSTLPAYSIIASDKKNNTVFYAASGSTFYVSTNSGATFTAAATLGSSTSPVRITARWDTAGDVWVSTDKGLYHSTNYGSTFTTIANVTQAWYIGLGAPKTSGGYPAVFVSASFNSAAQAIYRSDDTGSTWVQINDVAHGFGSAGQRISGDPRIYGRIYISGDGRGIWYGDIAGSTTTTSSSSTTTTTTTTTTSTTSTTTKTTTTSTSTSTSTTSTSTTTTSSSSSASCTVAKYGQCGGTGYTGCTTCASGSTCTVQNAYYYQCV